MEQEELNKKIVNNIQLALAQAIVGIADTKLRGKESLVTNKNFEKFMAQCCLIACSTLVSEATGMDAVDQVIDDLSLDLEYRILLRQCVRAMVNIAPKIREYFKEEIMLDTERQKGTGICLAS